VRNSNVKERSGTRTKEGRAEEEMFVIYSHSSPAKIFPAWLACWISKYL
jgi:hypothetical protein